eukprot:gene2090-4085_t
MDVIKVNPIFGLVGVFKKLSTLREKGLPDFYAIQAIIFLPLCLFIANGPESSYVNDSMDMPVVILSMTSTGFKYTLVVILTISCVLLVEVSTDNLSNMRNMFSIKGSVINLIILSAMLISSIINFFISIPTHNFQLMFRIYQIRNIIVVSTVLSYAYRYGKSIWRSPIVFLASLIGFISRLLRIVSLCQPNTKSNGNDIQWTLATALDAISGSVLLFYMALPEDQIETPNVVRRQISGIFNVNSFHSQGGGGGSSRSSSVRPFSTKSSRRSSENSLPNIYLRNEHSDHYRDHKVYIDNMNEDALSVIGSVSSESFNKPIQDSKTNECFSSLDGKIKNMPTVDNSSLSPGLRKLDIALESLLLCPSTKKPSFQSEVTVRRT